MAVPGVLLATFLADKVFELSVHVYALYSTGLFLVVYNVVCLRVLNHAVKIENQKFFSFVNKSVNTQIALDLVVLTVLLHFSGGIENPFIIYFVFHMVIASILLPVRTSYLHATLAIFLLTLLVLLEYRQIIPHYCLEGFIVRDIHRDGRQIVGSLFVFMTTLYLVVYMTSSIAEQLRNQEEAYWQANTQLRQKDRIKDEYVSRVTHDIKGHLAAIHSCLDVAANKTIGTLNDQQSEFVGRALKRTRTLSAFIRTLLELTQMRLDNKLKKEVFSLGDSIRDALDAVKIKAEKKQITVSCKIEPAVDRILGNRFAVVEMVTNLLLNAIKYTPQNGSVEVNANVQNKFILTEINDTGIGIPQDELPYIFDEFYRAANARKTEKDGTGLGLSIVKQIIERLDGEIWVESREGIGSTFKFKLPRAD
jgi:signal transduction histidine kinase